MFFIVLDNLLPTKCTTGTCQTPTFDQICGNDCKGYCTNFAEVQPLNYCEDRCRCNEEISNFVDFRIRKYSLLRCTV